MGVCFQNENGLALLKDGTPGPLWKTFERATTPRPEAMASVCAPFAFNFNLKKKHVDDTESGQTIYVNDTL